MLLSDVEFALKNSTFLDHNKVTHSMELVIYVDISREAVTA